MLELTQALAEVRSLVLGPGLVRAVAAGRRRGAPNPTATKVTIRPVRLKSGPHLQFVVDDGVRPTTVNEAPGDAPARVDTLLAQPYGNWHVETADQTVQLRVTKKGQAQLHRSGPTGAVADVAHDRTREHLVDPGDPLYDVIGGNAAKRRQVDAFLRALRATLPDDLDRLPRPLHVVDLGCGNAYLTFAAYRYLTDLGLDASVTGVDVREDQRVRNSGLAERLGWSDRVRFVAGTIADATVAEPVHMVLALHACDTASDDALARAVGWGAQWILAAPCCHKDVSRQLRRGPAAAGTDLLTAHGILRERFADVLTDALRAGILREHGYRVEVVEFIDSAHTPRNALIRAVRTGTGPDRTAPWPELAKQWGVAPYLARLLEDGPVAVTPR